MKTILFTGGGTGGHIMPNVALFPYFNDVKIHYVGEANSMEERIIKKYPFVTFHAIRCVKFRRSFSVKNLKIPFVLTAGILDAKKVLKEVQPDVIFSKGGYVSLPVCIASKGKNLIVHESDRSLGLANKISAKFASKVIGAFEGGNYEYYGSPLRPELYEGKESIALADCGFTTSLPTLLIMGGSQGSRNINMVVEKALPELIKKFNVVHIAGGTGKDMRSPGYRQIKYTDNIQHYFALADYCISRGGANSLFELLSLAIPALIIPLSSGSRGDQILNAQHYSQKNMLHLLHESNLTPATLLSSLQNLVNDRTTITTAIQNQEPPDGTKKIASLLRSYL